MDCRPAEDANDKPCRVNAHNKCKFVDMQRSYVGPSDLGSVANARITGRSTLLLRTEVADQAGHTNQEHCRRSLHLFWTCVHSAEFSDHHVQYHHC